MVPTAATISSVFSRMRARRSATDSVALRMPRALSLSLPTEPPLSFMYESKTSTDAPASRASALSISTDFAMEPTVSETSLMAFDRASATVPNSSAPEAIFSTPFARSTPSDCTLETSPERLADIFLSDTARL